MKDFELRYVGSHVEVVRPVRTIVEVEKGGCG